MKAYSQNDPKWKNEKLGTCTDTIGQSGCFITALGCLTGINPSEVNRIMKSGGAYSKGCLLNSERAAELLHLNYAGKITTPPSKFPVIAETDFYAPKKVPQHFFVYLENGDILDPIDGKQKKNPYHIVSWRLFSLKAEVPMSNEIDQVVANKIGEFKIDGAPAVYQVFAIPSEEFNNNVLKNRPENLRTLPADWPLDIREWPKYQDEELAAAQQALVKQTEDSTTKIIELSGKNAQLQGELDSTLGHNTVLRKDVASLEKELQRCKDTTPPVTPQNEVVEGQTDGFIGSIIKAIIKLFGR